MSDLPLEFIGLFLPGTAYKYTYIDFYAIFVSESTKIIGPVVNLVGLCHPGTIIKKLTDERSNAESSDGMFSRFLINCPKPAYPLWDSVEPIDDELPSYAR